MKIKNVGTIVEVKDGVAKIKGLSGAGYNQIVTIKTLKGKVEGLILNLEKEAVGAVVMGNYEEIRQGDVAEYTERELSIKVDKTILGQVVDPMGRKVDSEEVAAKDGEEMPLEKVAAGVIARRDVDRPLYTGIMAIDATIPIGKGQRELIIGDKKTGKTSIAIDAIIKQKGSGVICVYVAIGQKASKIAQIQRDLIEAGVWNQTVMVTAGAAKPAVWQYLAPYSGVAIAEYFAQRGEDVLVIYDDLSKHANAYREISLLLNRPPGREAYPGDIFYLHSRLLERALQYSEELGGGSITALPIIETQAGDLSAYIPTNVISITDGQIFLDSEMFNGGQRPAINIGASVSRVGSSAQIKAMKQVAGPLKLDLAQFRELQAFAQFGSDLDETTATKLKKGELLIKLLNQKERQPIEVAEQVTSLVAATKNLIPLEIDDVSQWREDWRKFLRENGSKVKERINRGEKIEGALEEEIVKLISSFNQSYA